MLDREQFYFLYVNVNSLAELGVQQAAMEVLRAIESEPPPAPVNFTDEEIAARLQADFESMDLSALDGIDFNFFGAPPAQAGTTDPLPATVNGSNGEGSNGEDLSEGLLKTAAVPSPSDWPPRESDLEGGEQEVDVAAYMNRAYNHEDVLRERLDRYYRQSNLAQLESLLAGLTALPVLTQRLTAEQMAHCLAQYTLDNQPLGDLVTTIRQLDMGENVVHG